MATNRKSQNAYIEALRQSQAAQTPQTQPSATMGLSFVQPNKVNEYDILGYLPSTVSTVMGKQTKEKLGAEARALVPDVATFSSALIDRDIYAADKNKYQNALQSISSDYLSKYAKDPYFAFTKEAKNMVSKMQRVATAPELAEKEELKANNEAARKIAETKEIWGNPIVHDGKVKVHRNNGFQMINPKNIRESDVVVTVSDDYNLVQRGDKKTPLTTDMSSYEDVMDKITDSVDNLGESEKTVLFGKTQIKGKSQEEQSKMRLKWLMQQGLSQSDMNTLTSEYIKRHGAPKNKNDINNWILSQANSYMNSSLDESNLANAEDIAGNGVNVGDVKGTDAVAKNLQKGFQGTVRALSVMNLPDASPEEKAAIKTKTQEAKEVIGEPLLNTLVKNKADVEIIQPISKSVWFDVPQPLSKGSVTSNGRGPLNKNTLIHRIRESGSQITTADGYPIKEENAIPDVTRDSFIVMEEGKPVMYLPVIYYEDTYGPFNADVVDDSNYMGKRENDGSYSNDNIGDVEDANGKGKEYVEIMKEAGLAVDEEWQAISIDDDIYEGVVRVPLNPDYETQAKMLDGTNFYTSKAAEHVVDGYAEPKQQTKSYIGL